jgi:hypothetical protein
MDFVFTQDATILHSYAQLVAEAEGLCNLFILINKKLITLFFLYINVAIFFISVKGQPFTGKPYFGI